MVASPDAGLTRAPWRADALPVTFGTVETDCLLLGRREDAPAVEARIDDIARHRLPAAVAEALSPALASASGIIRINRIALEISLSRDALTLGDLARLWAAEIARALSEEIAGRAGANVAWFADHGDFAAAYLERRFGEAGHPAWAFTDFAPLDQLTPAEAALEIIRARPAYLAAIARRAARRGMPGRLATRLGRSQVLDLVQGLAGAEVIASERARIVEVLRRLLTDLPAADAGGADPVNPLGVALEMLALDEALPPLTALAAARVSAALVEIIRRSGGADGPDRARQLRTALAVAKHEPGAGAFAALAPWLEYEAGREEIPDLLERLSGAPPVPEAAEEQEPEQTEAEAAPETAQTGERLILSPFAGVALCLTTIRGLRLHQLLQPKVLHAMAVALSDPKRQPLARTDPGIAVLFPADPHHPEPVWPEIPNKMLEPLTEDQSSAIDEATGAERWALLVLARLAHALPGLGASSATYMRRQFVHAGGTLHWMDDAVEVSLDPVPLGIVLSMAGATGWQGPLPWLEGRELTIRIRASR